MHIIRYWDTQRAEFAVLVRKISCSEKIDIGREREDSISIEKRALA